MAVRGSISLSSSSVFTSQFVRVDHDNGLTLDDDFILVGRETHGQWNYSVRSTGVKDVKLKDFSVHVIANNVLVLQTQFDDSLAYSAATWVSQNGCDKDTGKFLRPEHREVSNETKSSDADISVVIDTSDTPYRYQIKSRQTPPSIRFMVPGMMTSQVLFVF